jgi:predicted esterase
VAAVLSAMLEQGALPPHIRFDFAVLISGFLPRDPRFSAVCDAGKIGKVRSLHVVGKADDIVEPDRSMRVLGIFHSAELVEHEKGHLVPSDKHVRDAIKAFIMQQGAPAT